MTALEAIVIGVVQGITEFLPVSSDGHLILAEKLIGVQSDPRSALGFDILLHAGSLIAILIMYRKIWLGLIKGLFSRDAESLRVIALLIVATIPGVIAGLLLQDTVSDMRSYGAIGIGFLITGVVLIVSERIGKKVHHTTKDHLSFARAAVIGLAQAVAILPGVSRSGSTIAAGRVLGLERSSALDFSFLMAAPIIGGAVAKTLLDAYTGAVVFPSPVVSISGFIASLCVSFCAILLLKILVIKHSLAVFSWYLLPLGIVLVSYTLLRTPIS